MSRLWADTHAPPQHLYRAYDLGRVEAHRAAATQVAEAWEAIRSVRASAAEACEREAATLPDRLSTRAGAELAELLAVTPDLELTARPNVVRRQSCEAGEDVAFEVEIDLEASSAPSWRGRVIAHVRASAVDALSRERRNARSAPTRPPRVLLTTLVRNEADRYLARVLERALPLCNEVLVSDDASDDDSVEVCRSVIGDVAHEILRLDRSLFHREHELRALQ